MTASSHAVFLSYASQDTEATQRICEALRAAGIEVWFDKSELRGGDAWDRSIRQQIHDSALFVPIISQHTHERLEGYFRREWRLAVERAGDMAENKAFLVPVVIDNTADRDPSVPEKFRELQWTRLPDGETSPAFVERIQGLLAGEAAPASEGARTASPVASTASAPRGLIRPGTGVIYGAIAAAALLAVGYFGLERLTGSKLRVPGAASIAVLPLANESGEASQQYFSDGISEDLITALSQFPGLKVIGRTSSFQFRDSKEDSRSIGAKLGVAHLLEGSVRRSGEMVRVSAELIDTADGSTQWSEHYDRPYKDLFALQDEITRAVSGRCKARLLTGRACGGTERAAPEREPRGLQRAAAGPDYYRVHDTEADESQGDRFPDVGNAARSELCAGMERAVAGLDRPRSAVPRRRSRAGGVREGTCRGRPCARLRTRSRGARISPAGDLLVRRLRLARSGSWNLVVRWRSRRMTAGRSSISLTQLAIYGEMDQAIELYAAGARRPIRCGPTGTSRSPPISWDFTASMRPSRRCARQSSCSPTRRRIARHW